MKLNYREKVILAIFLAAMILIGGFFGLIKPKNKTIKEDKKTLSTKKDEEKETKNKIAQIGDFQDQIKQIVSDSKEVTDKFVDKDEVNSTVELDEFMQHFANENEIRITDLAVGDMTETALDYYYIRWTDIGSGLRELADFTGEYQKEVDDDLAEQNQLSERAAENVLKTEYAFTATGKKENLWKFMEAIEKYDDAILINSVDYDTAPEENENQQNPEGAAPQEQDDNPEIKPEDTVTINMKISLYSVYELKTPKFEEAE